MTLIHLSPFRLQLDRSEGSSSCCKAQVEEEEFKERIIGVYYDQNQVVITSKKKENPTLWDRIFCCLCCHEVEYDPQAHTAVLKYLEWKHGAYAAEMSPLICKFNLQERVASKTHLLVKDFFLLDNAAKLWRAKSQRFSKATDHLHFYLEQKRLAPLQSVNTLQLPGKEEAPLEIWVEVTRNLALSAFEFFHTLIKQPFVQNERLFKFHDKCVLDVLNAITKVKIGSFLKTEKGSYTISAENMKKLILAELKRRHILVSKPKVMGELKKDKEGLAFLEKMKKQENQPFSNQDLALLFNKMFHFL